MKKLYHIVVGLKSSDKILKNKYKNEKKFMEKSDEKIEEQKKESLEPEVGLVRSHIDDITY